MDGIYIGNMDRRIRITERLKTISGTGAETGVPNIIVECWAEKKTASTDKVLDEKVVAFNIVVWQMHWDPAIVAKNIQSLFIEDIDSGNEFEVYGKEEIGRKKYLRLKCQERE